MLPGDGCEIGVKFAPTTTGNKVASLTLTDSGGTQLSTVVSLTGTGISPLNGDIRFRLYKGSCTSGNLIYSETVNVAGDGTYHSNNVSDLLSALNQTKFGDPDTDGTYNWDIDYSGDTHGNPSINGACGTEGFTVTNGADA